MEKAIKKAIEGGYRLDGEIWLKEYQEVGFKPDMFMYLSNSLFWQALGKVEKWSKCIFCSDAHKRDFKCGNCEETGILPKMSETKNKKGGWLFYWHNFIDHIAQGKDIDSFFEDLLTNKQE